VVNGDGDVGLIELEPARRERNLSLAELTGEPWVLAQPGSLALSLQDQVVRNSGFEPPPATVHTVSLHLYMRLIENGRCLGLVPSSAMRFGGRQLKALPVKLVTPPEPVGYYHYQVSNTHAARRAVD
jgi:DNA-binding transcriptional LysR family regulator